MNIKQAKGQMEKLGTHIPNQRVWGKIQEFDTQPSFPFWRLRMKCSQASDKSK